MKQRPTLQDGRVIDRLREVYGVDAARLEFLPIGDISSAKYRVFSNGPASYFLKLRTIKLKEVALTIPHFLHHQGIWQVLSPLVTKEGKLWTDLEGYTCLLYPFIEGQNGFNVRLTADQWLEFGSALRLVHSVRLPDDLQREVPFESLTPAWREEARGCLAQAETASFEDPLSAGLAALIREHAGQLRWAIDRADALAEILASRNLPFVLCHTDIHAGNLLVEPCGVLHLIDWDDPLLAPRERDLMIIGAGIGGIWNTRKEEARFYHGYGQVEVDPVAIAYYRFERLLVDLVEFSREILSPASGQADRERSLQKFSTTFLPGHVLEMALQTDRELQSG